MIFCVEDDNGIRELMLYALKASGFEAMGFENAAAFWEGMRGEKPELVILDIMLPDEDGIEILKKLRSRAATKTVPIILVTARSTELDKVKGLDQGADDYMTKPFGVMELIARVKALFRRSAEPEGKLLELGCLRIDEEKHMVYVKDTPCELTYKEYELLKLLMRNAGNVMARDTIMERVWGIDFEGESRTLDMHIKTLRQKLGEAGAMIKTVRNVGYRIEALE